MVNIKSRLPGWYCHFQVGHWLLTTAATAATAAAGFDGEVVTVADAETDVETDAEKSHENVALPWWFHFHCNVLGQVNLNAAMIDQ